MTKEQKKSLPAKIEQQQQDPFISMIERVASDNTVDIEKMERLLQMRENAIMKQEAREEEARKQVAKLAYFEDMAKAQSEIVPVVAADKGAHGSKYAALGAVNKAVNPIIDKYGFSVSYSPGKVEKNAIPVSCTVTHKGGHSETEGLEFPIDN